MRAPLAVQARELHVVEIRRERRTPTPATSVSFAAKKILTRHKCKFVTGRRLDEFHPTSANCNSQAIGARCNGGATTHLPHHVRPLHRSRPARAAGSGTCLGLQG